MFDKFIECTYYSTNLPRIHVKPEDFIDIIDKMGEIVIFREYAPLKTKRLSLTGYAGDKEPDIFIIHEGIIISTDAPMSITNLDDFKIMLLNKK